MLEIELANGGGYLDLDPSVRIQFEQNFNLHDFQHIEGTKSWKFQLPKTANNIKRTGWLNVPEVKSDFENSLRVRVVLNGSLWKTGPLYFISEKESYFEVHFAGEAGLLKQILGDARLREFNLPFLQGITDIYDHAKASTLLAPDSTPYVFAEVYVPNSSNPGTVPNYLNSNKFDTNAGDWLGFNGNISGDYAALCPFPYVKYNLNLIANQLGIKFGGAIWEDEEFSRMVFFNTVCLNELVNDQATGPPVNEIRVADHVPDVTLVKLLKSIAKLFNQIIVYDDKRSLIKFINRADIIKQPVNDSLRRRVSGIGIEFEEKRLYSLMYEFNQDDISVRDQRGSGTDLSGVFENSEQSQEIEVEFSTLPTLTSGIQYDEEPISSLDLNEDVPYQFLFYRGYKVYPQGIMPKNPETPYVSGDLMYTPATGYTLDSYSLAWLGNGGLYEVWWKNYLESLKLATVLKVKLSVSASELINFESIALYALHQYVGFFEEMSASFSGDTLNVEVQFLKL